MSFKVITVLISSILLLSGCALGGSDQATKDLEMACELVNARAPDDPAILPESLQFFASAARADIKFLPLAQAARLAQINPFTADGLVEIEIVKATTLILGYCTPRLAN